MYIALTGHPDGGKGCTWATYNTDRLGPARQLKLLDGLRKECRPWRSVPTEWPKRQEQLSVGGIHQRILLKVSLAYGMVATR
eukprot:629227-Ditylum_brightwellii.AAC.1